MDRRHTFIGAIEAATQKAVLFHATVWLDPEWLPRAHIAITGDWAGEVEVKIADWLVRANGWDEMGDGEVIDDAE